MIRATCLSCHLMNPAQDKKCMPLSNFFSTWKQMPLALPVGKTHYSYDFPAGLYRKAKQHDFHMEAASTTSLVLHIWNAKTSEKCTWNFVDAWQGDFSLNEHATWHQEDVLPWSHHLSSFLTWELQSNCPHLWHWWSLYMQGSRLESWISDELLRCFSAASYWVTTANFYNREDHPSGQSSGTRKGAELCTQCCDREGHHAHQADCKDREHEQHHETATQQSWRAISCNIEVGSLNLYL